MITNFYAWTISDTFLSIDFLKKYSFNIKVAGMYG